MNKNLQLKKNELKKDIHQDQNTSGCLGQN